MLSIKELIQYFLNLIGISAADHSTLDTEHLISHTRGGLADMIASAKFVWGVMVASEVHKLSTKTHYILDSVMSKCVDDTACISPYVLDSVSRQHWDFWALLFPFIHNSKHTFAP